MKKLFLMLALLFGSMIHVCSASSAVALARELKALLQDEFLDRNLDKVKSLVGKVDLSETWRNESGWSSEQKNYFSLIRDIGSSYDQKNAGKRYPKQEILQIFLTAGLKLDTKDYIVAFQDLEILEALIGIDAHKKELDSLVQSKRVTHWILSAVEKIAEHPKVFKYVIECGLYTDLLKEAGGVQVVLNIHRNKQFTIAEKEALIEKCKKDGFDFNKKFKLTGVDRSTKSMNYVEWMFDTAKAISKDLKKPGLSSSAILSGKELLSDMSSVIKSSVAHGATITAEMKAEAETLGFDAEIFVAPGSTIGSGKMIGGVVVIAGIAAAVYFYFKSKKDAAKKKKTVPKKADQKEIDINEENKTIREMNKKQEGALHLATV